jgi:hypothetical protein
MRKKILFVLSLLFGLMFINAGLNISSVVRSLRVKNAIEIVCIISLSLIG